MNKSKIVSPKEHCYWVWFKELVNGEPYIGVLAETPKEALSAAGKYKMKVNRVFNCYTMENFDISRGTIIN